MWAQFDDFTDILSTERLDRGDLLRNGLVAGWVVGLHVNVALSLDVVLDKNGSDGLRYVEHELVSRFRLLIVEFRVVLWVFRHHD